MKGYPVIQSDRDAANHVRSVQLGRTVKLDDNRHSVQAFAKHRIEAAAELLGALEILCEGIVDLYSAISNGDRESGQRFAEADPKYVAARAAIARATGEA